MYDFAVPSEVTLRVEDTYDGRHYGNAVNARVTRRLAGAEDTFGLRVDGLTLEAYGERYARALRAFEARDAPLP